MTELKGNFHIDKVESNGECMKTCKYHSLFKQIQTSYRLNLRIVEGQRELIKSLTTDLLKFVEQIQELNEENRDLRKKKKKTT